jgi:hypothetical protein
MTRSTSKRIVLLAAVTLSMGAGLSAGERTATDNAGVKSVTFDDVKLDLKKGDP